MICKWCKSQNRAGANFCATCRAALVDGLTTGNLKSGQRLHSRYEVRKLLGSGGMSTVYGVLDTTLSNRRLAMKELNPARIADPQERADAVELFKEEVETLVSLELDHPNLIKISDRFSEGGNQYMVMDYVDGTTLDDYLHRYGPVPEQTVIEWARQIGNALSYLHNQEQPIIFRDLKPSNIMLDKANRIKLIDFGIARRFKSGKSQDTKSFGSLGFAPPEQYGRGQTDARSDIYALCATIYALLTGYDLSQNPLQLPPIRQLLPTVSPATERVLTVGLQQDAKQRWQSVDQMLSQLPNVQYYPPITVTALSKYFEPNQAGTLSKYFEPNQAGAQTNRVSAGAPAARSTSPTQRLAVLAAQLSNTQLALALAALTAVFVILVSLFAVPVAQSIPDFEVRFPILATAGAFAYMATLRRGAALLTFFTLVMASTIATRIQFAAEGNYIAVAPLDTAIIAALIAGAFMEVWLYFLPAFRGTNDLNAWQRELIWLAIMGAISTVLLYVPIYGGGIVGRFEPWIGGAADGAVGWFLGDFVQRFLVERQTGVARARPF